MTAVCLILDNSIARGEVAAPSAVPVARRDVRVVKRVSDVLASGKASAPARRSQPCAYFAGEYVGPELALGNGLGTGWALAVDACGGAGWFDYAAASGAGPLYGRTLCESGIRFAHDVCARLGEEGYGDPTVRAVWGPGYERGLTLGQAARDEAECHRFCDRMELEFPGAVIALRKTNPGQTAYSSTDRAIIDAGRTAVAAARGNVVLIDWGAAEISGDFVHPTANGSQALGAAAALTIRAAVTLDECLDPLFPTHPEPFVYDGAYLPWGALPADMLGDAWWLRYRGPLDGLRYLLAFGSAPAIRIDSTSTDLRVVVSAGPDTSTLDVMLSAPLPQQTVDLDVLIDFGREGAAPRTANVAMRIDGVEVARGSLDRDWRQLTPNHSAMILHRDLQWTANGEIAFYRGTP